ncbi:MAG: hypothetical protein ACRECX_05005 [Methyloceanibacter sp.]|uniref:hypothetical protein n=1 Tax=Methyloceanibacter sp. TaxID=1965321 RepID=UPI003D6D5464
METLFEQYPLLLPALGILAVASLFALVWVATSTIWIRPPGDGRDRDAWPGGATFTGTGGDAGCSNSGGGDCGGGGGGGD